MFVLLSSEMELYECVFWFAHPEIWELSVQKFFLGLLKIKFQVFLKNISSKDAMNCCHYQREFTSN